eukprot:TRINITY_DN84_c0_g1_i1.p1 TRINITY_DN84_c0_g1~~TRINITY_DN84_c0_g1_i1.p1  ORF type:complete len:326 (+),score=151.67 TRINITY_DN84_c0_g1_i1:51-980(+)
MSEEVKHPEGQVPEHLLPTRLGDESAFVCNQGKARSKTIYDSSTSLSGLGSGDTNLHVGFLSQEEADAAFQALQLGGEIEYQQWYHMPNAKRPNEPLQKLRRIKRALANPTPEGLIPHYRFPVNDQNRYGVQTPMSPTIEAIRRRVEALTGIPFNHAVILLYRGGDDCIGFHKDKELDLVEGSPIVSISFGDARPYVLRDNIHQPKQEQEFLLPHGALLVLGAQSNNEFYHSVRQLTEDEKKLRADQHDVRVSLTFRHVGTFRDAEGKLYGKGADYQTLNWPENLRGAHRLDDDLDLPLAAQPAQDNDG